MATAKKLPSGTWRIQVYSHKEPMLGENGKPLIDEKTGKAKERRVYESFTCDTPGKQGKKEVERQAAIFLAEKDRKKRPENLTVKEAFEKYLEAKENVLSPTTLRGYITIKNNHIAEIAEIPIRRISQEYVQRWINTLAARLSPKSVKNAYGLFTAVMAMYFPDMVFRTKLPQQVQPEYYTPSDGDIKRLLKYLEGTEMEKAVLLAAFGTLRRGEICALTDKDIRGNTIIIRKAKVRGTHGMITKSPKTDSSYRFVEFPEFVIRKFDGIEGPLVKMHPEDISKKFGLFLEKAGIPHFRFHDLRHYSASIMHAIGIPDQYIMKRGGWKSDNILKKVYRNTIEAENKKFVEKVNDHFESMQHDMQHGA